MTRALAFWVLMLIWLVVGISWHFGMIGTYGPLGLVFIVFILFGLLGWQVFGAPLHG